MGLIVTPIAPATIQISGTSLTVPNVYARIYMACDPSGITMSIGYHIYASKETFETDQPLFTDVPNQTFQATLDPVTQEQSITTALEFAKVGFEQLNDGIYTAVIDTSE